MLLPFINGPWSGLSLFGLELLGSDTLGSSIQRLKQWGPCHPGEVQLKSQLLASAWHSLSSWEVSAERSRGCKHTLESLSAFQMSRQCKPGNTELMTSWMWHCKSKSSVLSTEHDLKRYIYRLSLQLLMCGQKNQRKKTSRILNAVAVGFLKK